MGWVIGYLIIGLFNASSMYAVCNRLQCKGEIGKLPPIWIAGYIIIGGLFWPFLWVYWLFF